MPDISVKLSFTKLVAMILSTEPIVQRNVKERKSKCILVSIQC